MKLFSTTPLTPFLSPNSRKSDYLFALKQLLNPLNWKQWQKIQKKTYASLNSLFFPMFGERDFFYFDSGRTALYAILRSLDFKNGDEVAMQAFTCVALPNAIRAAGAVPHFIDIDDTFNLSVDKLQSTLTKPHRLKAVIVQHTFGIPANLAMISDICQKHKIILIEDCAHVIGAKINHQIIGTFGDATMFSFGRDKALSTVSGGMAFTKNQKIQEKLAAYWQGLPLPPKRWIFQRLLHPIIFLFAKKTYYWLSFGQIIIILAKFFRLIPKVLTSAEYKGDITTYGFKLPDVFMIWLSNQMKILTTFNNHRRNITKIYENNLRHCPQIKLPTLSAGFEPIYLRYPLLAPKRLELRRYAKKYGIMFGDWYDQVIAPRQVDLIKQGYIMNSCSQAEKMSAQIINLPTNYEISPQAAKFICKIILKFYNNVQ